jgi:hypothetical protein
VLDNIEYFRKALGLETTWVFVLIIGLGCGLFGGLAAWIVDRAAKAEHLSVQGQQAQINQGQATQYPPKPQIQTPTQSIPAQPPKPAKSPASKSPAPWIKSDGHNQRVEITDNKFSADRPAIDLGPDSGELIISRNVFGTPTTSPEDQRLVNGRIADYVKLYPKEGERIVKGESPSPLETWINGKLRDKGVHWTVKMKQLEGERRGLNISVTDPSN